MKNLAAVAEKTTAGTTLQQTPDVKGKIVEYVFHLQKEGLRDSTLEQKHQLLHRLITLGADLANPDTVKAAVARLERSESYKLLLCIAYEGFASYYGIPWTRPNYRQCEKLPFTPHETEIDALIAGTDRKTSALLRLLKETAMRLGEAWHLEWTHLDVQNHSVTCNNPEKNSRPRIFNITPDLTQMLDKQPKVNQYIFGCGRNVQQGKIDPKVHMKLLLRQKSRITRQRERVAAKLQNPRIREITYHTLRHWKATMLYHQTKDILHVMKFLGHKSLNNTLIYIDLETACFPNGGDDYVGKVATTQTEALNLIEAGFEHVCVAPDGTMYFKKRR
jgi:integrase